MEPERESPQLTAAPLYVGVVLCLLTIWLAWSPLFAGQTSAQVIAVCAVAGYIAAYLWRWAALKRNFEEGDLRPVIGEFLDGVAVTLIMTLVIGALFRITPLGAQAEKLAFEAFNYGRPAAKREPQVVVVDSSSVARTPVTDRAKLEAFLRKTVLEAPATERPAAIGFDVNFRQPGGGFVNPDEGAEIAFLEVCIEADRAMKGPTAAENAPSRVRLGTTRALLDPPDTWMPMPRYLPMATSLDVPETVFARSYASFRVPTGETMPSMGLALARALRGEIPKEGGLPGTQLFGGTGILDRADADLHSLDFAWLPILERETLKFDDLLNDTALRQKLAGKAVMVGDVEEASIQDAFSIPGRVRPLAGVYLHALSAQTLASSPLYEFEPNVNALLDVIVGIVGVFCLTVLPALGRGGSVGGVEALVRLTVVLIVIAVGALWALSRFGVAWLDAYNVALGLALGPFLEAGLMGAVARFTATGKRPAPSHDPEAGASDELADDES